MVRRILEVARRCIDLVNDGAVDDARRIVHQFGAPLCVTRDPYGVPTPEGIPAGLHRD